MNAELTIYYYTGKGRSTLTARIMRGEERLKDLSTGVKIDSSWNAETKRFAKNNKANQELIKFEGDIFAKWEECKFLFKGNVPSDAFVRILSNKKVQPIEGALDLTLKGIAAIYKKRSEEKNIFSKRTGKRLSDATFEGNIYTSRLIERYINSGGENLDVNTYNLGNMPMLGKAALKSKYDNFISSFKTFLIGEGQDEGTLFKNTYRVKNMINYVTELYGLEVGHLLKELKYKKPKKEVVVMSNAQIEFVIKNYEKIRSECSRPRQRQAVDVWYTALVLDPRRKDMFLWTRDNLVTGTCGNTWIKYIPHKTKNSSGVKVESLVPATLLAIFRRNLDQYGKLLPPYNHNLNLCLKAIAKRYPEVFGNEIQVVKRGEFIKVKMYDYVHIHMMRGSGMTHKLENGWTESEVKEQSGHTYDSESFKRYVKISQDAKRKASEQYFEKLGI